MIEAAVSGLSNAAIDSAHIFRAVLEAMSQPGRIVDLARYLDAPAPLLHTTAALCVTLCDYDTPLWIEPILCSPKVADYLRFHTGAPIRNTIPGSSFIICSAGFAESALASSDRGTPEYPDRSATLIVQVRSFSDARAVVLSGPGVKSRQSFAGTGLGLPFWTAAAANHALYPLGTDFIFASPQAVAALPRSTQITFAEPN